MKSVLTILLITLMINGFSQITEKEINTSVEHVTIYIDGAQVTRIKSVDLAKGSTTLKFTNLSPYIDAKSINVKSSGNLTVLSVNHRQNFLNEKMKSAKAEDLIRQKTDLESKIKYENTQVEILNDQLAFLKANSQVGGTTTGINMATLREAVTFYNEKLTSVKLKLIEENARIEELNKQLNKINNQIIALSSEQELPAGEILVDVDVKAATQAKFEISYLVNNAGWNPAYDVRVKDISQPALLVYRANVRQNSGEDWKNIRLKLSSGNPKAAGNLQELKPYLLIYNTLPPTYDNNLTQIYGYVRESKTGKALPGATIQVKGTTIGTVADINGYYSINIPAGGGILVFSFIGFRTQEQPANRQQINVTLFEEKMELNEVVVTGYGTQQDAIRMRGNKKMAEAAPATEMFALQSEVPLEVAATENQTTVEFEIETPYTIPSNGQNFTIDVMNYTIPAEYQYVSIPKISQQVFLNAMITDWEKLNLLEGEANVFFEDTYTGKTLLDVRKMADTLTISLGPDKSISVKRELQKKFTTKQFLGNKKEESKSWMITLRNNKQQPVNLVLYDQVPVSTLEEIEVTYSQLSGGKLDRESGKVTWELKLNPAEKKEVLLNYSVKYPKNQNLIVE